MSNRKIQNGEQKIITLIGENVENANLNYSNIKDRIVIETNKERKESPKRNHSYFMARYVAACSLIVSFFIISILAMTNSHFFTNVSLTNFVMNINNENNYQYESGMFFQETELYSVLDNKYELSNAMVVELDMPTIDEGGIYCAYLSKNLISSIKNYSLDEDYLSYKSKISYYGIDDNLAKYYYYCQKEGIQESQINSHLKWVKYENNDKIKSKINNNGLVFVSLIRNINQAYDINTKQLIDVKIKCIVEIKDNKLSDNSSVDSLLSNIEYDANGGKYLFNISKNTKQEQIFTDEYFSDNSALIEEVNGSPVVRGIIPLWYEDSSNNDNFDDYNNKQKYITQLDTWIENLNIYLLYSKETEFSGSREKTYVNYYDYSVVEFLIGD